jgi:hypothetical protein
MELREQGGTSQATPNSKRKATAETKNCSRLTILGALDGFIISPMKLKPKQVIALRCPTCGAAPGQKCELSTGLTRFEPHQARRLAAGE